MKHNKMQGGIDAYALRARSCGYDDEQIIGFVMLNFNVFYDEAKMRVEQALSKIAS